MFKHPITQKQVTLPHSIQLSDGRSLAVSGEKSSGISPGGWYKDDKRSDEFMVKIGVRTVYHEKLLTDLARVCIDEKFLPKEMLVSDCEFDGRRTPCLVTSKIPDFRELLSIRADTRAEAATKRQEHSQKFHPTYAFNTLISYDDSNEENLGLSTNDRAVIVDYETFPSFLHQEQSEYCGLPFSLASFIGHQSPVAMQMIRRRHFGDITHAELLGGIKKIIEKEEGIYRAIREVSTSAAQSEALRDDEKENLQKFFGDFEAALKKRISWMKENFAEDLVALESGKIEQETRWVDHPKFRELMEQEANIFKLCATRSHEKNLGAIAEKLGLEGGNIRQRILNYHFDNDEKKSPLKELINDKQNRKFVLHNAIICGDVGMVKWLIDNDLCDINETYWNRKHNYQFFRLTPLSMAIALKRDGEKYDFWRNENSDKIIEILRQKFSEKNGERDVSRELNHHSESAEGDKLAIWATRIAIMEHSSPSSTAKPAAAAAVVQQLVGRT